MRFSLECGHISLKRFNAGKRLLQGSGEQRDQFGLVDALILRVALIVHFVLLTRHTLRHKRLHLMREEAINSLVRVSNEVEPMHGDLCEAVGCTCQRDYVFLETVVGGGVVGCGADA
jgi:hypothetical protein